MFHVGFVFPVERQSDRFGVGYQTYFYYSGVGVTECESNLLVRSEMTLNGYRFVKMMMMQLIIIFLFPYLTRYMCELGLGKYVECGDCSIALKSSSSATNFMCRAHILR